MLYLNPLRRLPDRVAVRLFLYFSIEWERISLRDR
jgi:hypothetical protein